jgi:hypothetical protein
LALLQVREGLKAVQAMSAQGGDSGVCSAILDEVFSLLYPITSLQIAGIVGTLIDNIKPKHPRYNTGSL